MCVLEGGRGPGRYLEGTSASEQKMCFTKGVDLFFLFFFFIEV